MRYYVYKVYKIDRYKNTAQTLEYDYTRDFNELVRIRLYVKIDYYITDTPDLVKNEVYFTGDLIKVIERVTEFDGEPIQYIKWGNNCENRRI